MPFSKTIKSFKIICTLHVLMLLYIFTASKECKIVLTFYILMRIYHNKHDLEKKKTIYPLKKSIK